MKGKRSKRYPVPSGTQFTEGGETFTIVGPISDEQFVDYANRWPGANRLLRNRKDSPFLFASADTRHWVIFDEFGYPVSKSGIAVMDDIIGDGGSFTVGGYESHAEKYGDIQFLQRGFFNKLQEFRMPYAKNLAETERKIIAFSLSNDAPWRLQSYRKLGFEILPHTKKHPLLPDKYYQRFKRDATTYGVWVPNSLEDPAMKKAWEILKRPSDFQRFLEEVFGIPIADAKKISPSRSLTNTIGYGKLTEVITENEFKALINLVESKQYEAFITKLEQINSEYMEQINERTRERRKEKYDNDPEYRKRILQYNRERRKEKYANNPEYRKNQRRLDRERRKERYANDPEYRERVKRRRREAYRRKKERKE
tara:strand:- start:298 stop:1401 length:1104 start_codon:yes stop_codon:yes gene_type:complete